MHAVSTQLMNAAHRIASKEGSEGKSETGLFSMIGSAPSLIGVIREP